MNRSVLARACSISTLFLVSFGVSCLPVSADDVTVAASIAVGDRGVVGGFSVSSSADGRFVVLTSNRPLTPGVDGSGNSNVYLYDRSEGTMTLVSHSVDDRGAGGDDNSSGARVSADGAFVQFNSDADNLVAGSALSEKLQCYIYEHATGAIALGSAIPGASGVGGNDDSSGVAISADGRFTAIRSVATNLVTGADENGGNDLFLFDWRDGTLRLVTHANGDPTTTANGAAVDGSMSADASRVVFSSAATNLIAGFSDSNGGFDDVFAYDRVSATHELVSRFHGETLQGGNSFSQATQVSADGRHVLFRSGATDLVEDFGGNQSDVQLYRLNLLTGITRLVSHARTGLRDGANGSTLVGSINHDGSYVAFSSRATNLIPGFVDRNGDTDTDVYGWRSATGALTLLSHAEGNPSWGGDDDSEAPVLSADGSQVAFGSRASDLVAGFVEQNGSFDRDVYHWQRSTDSLSLVSHGVGEPLVGSDRDSAAQRFSAGGSTLTFFGRSRNLVADGATAASFISSTFLVPLAGGSPVGQIIERVSKLGFGVRSATGNLESLPARKGAISVDGAFVVFTSTSTDLVLGLTGAQGLDAVYLYDRDRATVSLVSHAAGNPVEIADGTPEQPRISGDGAYVIFQSTASNLVAGFVDNNGTEPDLYLYETATGTVSLVSRSTAGPTIGANGTGAAVFPDREPYAISGNSSFVAFTNTATDLLAGFIDRNGADRDLFLFERATGNIALVSHSVADPLTGGFGDGSAEPLMSTDGAYVVFESRSRDLVGGTNLGNTNIYLYARASGVVTLVSHLHTSATTGVATTATDQPQISANGATVAYVSSDPSLVPDYVGGLRDSVFLFDRDSGGTTLVTHAHGLPSTATNSDVDAFVLSADGAHVAFPTTATNVVAGQVDPLIKDDVFWWSRATNTSTLVSRRLGDSARTANDSSNLPLLAPDGSFVVFHSNATDLLDGYEPSSVGGGDAYRFDTVTGELSLISREPSDALAGVGATAVGVSQDGAFVAFRSKSERLIPRDFNLDDDVFLRGPDLDADLALQMTGAPNPAAPGTTIDYTLEVSNAGPGASGQVGVLFVLPPAMVLQNHSGTGWDCESLTADVLCTLATSILPGTMSSPLVLEAQALPFVGSITAAATVRAAVPDLFPANDRASATIVLTGMADLSIVATVDQATAIPGSPLGYQITATNLSAVTVSEAMVTDLFPASLDCAWTSVATGAATGNTAAAGLLADALTMPPGSTVTYAVTCAIDPAATATVSNTVSIGSAAGDPDLGNNQVKRDTMLTPRTDLALAKRANVAVVDPGNVLTYILSVTNEGASTSTGGTVSDPLPAGLTFVSSPDGCAEAGGSVTCAFGALDPAATVDLRFVVMVGAGAGPILQNTATVAGNEVDPAAGNNTDTEETTVMTAAPIVTAIGSLPDTGDGVLADCEGAQVGITELTVTFSEPMKDPAGDSALEDVTNPANYRLVASGPDLAFTTLDCASPTDDDQVISIDAVAYDVASLTARVDVNAGGPLRLGVYRLLVCGTLEDLLGNALDGDEDGTGGDEFRSGFRIAEPNDFSNADLDCSLDGWVGVSANPSEIEHSAEDADGAQVSGSAHIVNLTASNDFSFGQCVEVRTRGGYGLAGALRIDAEQGVQLDLTVTCEAFAAPVCGGASLAVDSQTFAVGDTGGSFVRLSSAGSLPGTTTSALCSVGLFTATADDFNAFLDRLVLRTGVVFADGFESGDTSAW